MSATATARKGKSSKSKKLGRYGTYDALRAIVSKPIAKRKEVPIGRGGELTIARKHHLDADEISALKQDIADNGKGKDNYVPNPFNRGNYHFIVASLLRLGANRPHSDPVVKAKFKELTSVPETKDGDGRTFWQRFKNRDPRAENEENALDWEGRFEQNVEVLQRLGGRHPYGLKLVEVGTKVLGTKGVVIDILKNSKGEKSYMLNTNSAVPRNQFRTRGAQAELEETTTAKPAKRKAKKKAPAAPAAESPKSEPETANSGGESNA